LERIYRIENAVRTIDRLYESFLTLRFSPEWTKNEKPRLAAWLRKEQE
jgi:recombination associated protein RdgC